jgi:hypothetical protein
MLYVSFVDFARILHAVNHEPLHFALLSQCCEAPWSWSVKLEQWGYFINQKKYHFTPFESNCAPFLPTSASRAASVAVTINQAKQKPRNKQLPKRRKRKKTSCLFLLASWLQLFASSALGPSSQG